jgi:hypothetical protein
MQNHVEAPKIPRGGISNVVLNEVKPGMAGKVVPKPLKVDHTNFMTQFQKPES